MITRGYHSRMNRLHALIDSGLLGAVIYECTFSSSVDAPFQSILRDAKTGRVDLAELCSDGSVIFKNKHFPYC